jgi:glycosyltransferase involved in cell wall biosynthesis
MLCGTPVISTDWGVFSETIHQGVTGYRCSWLPEFVEAARLAPKLDRAKIREINLRYSTEVVKKDYQRWFDRLDAMRNSDPNMFR